MRFATTCNCRKLPSESELHGVCEAVMFVGEDGRGSMVLDGDPNAAAAAGRTLEPAGGSTAPTTDPLVVLALA